ncbi:hypothetical protein C0Q70_00949 [Pomacea canaliculata]|uniref:G protein gamma domain-containing protein n=1 Tax=Pomacea canaliculata TaxID=400727 RepID=A0A2T7PY70_POMCA|nr:hypothetical protein C0Q70_00949 [Pomacea canaliculata]
MDARSRKLQEAVQRQKDLLSQLQVEASIRRQKVSVSIADIVQYCQTHLNEDHLIKGFAKPSDNPFSEKQRCSIL